MVVNPSIPLRFMLRNLVHEVAQRHAGAEELVAWYHEQIAQQIMANIESGGVEQYLGVTKMPQGEQ